MGKKTYNLILSGGIIAVVLIASRGRDRYYRRGAYLHKTLTAAEVKQLYRMGK